MLNELTDSKTLPYKISAKYGVSVVVVLMYKVIHFPKVFYGIMVSSLVTWLILGSKASQASVCIPKSYVAEVILNV
jgi:hypothetical protein